jgi:hypothetical protein
VFSSFGDEERDWWWCEEADPGQEDISSPLRRLFFFFFFLFFYYTKQSNQQQKNSFSGVSYCRESALQIRAVPPVFTPFIFRGAEWNEKKNPKNGPRLSSLTGWVAAA